MTDQTPPNLKQDDNDTVEEASSLLFGPGGGVPARTKKHGVPTMRTTMNLFTKNNTIGYNTIVDDTEDKEAGEDHHENDTTTISTKNRRNMFLVVIGVSVSVLVVGMLRFWATSASSALPSSASVSSSLSSLRTAALEDSREDKVVDGWFQCYPNGDPCYAGYPFPNGGCCDTASCVRRNLAADKSTHNATHSTADSSAVAASHPTSDHAFVRSESGFLL